LKIFTSFQIQHVFSVSNVLISPIKITARLLHLHVVPRKA